MISLAKEEIERVIKICFNTFNGVINPGKAADKLMSDKDINTGMMYVKYQDNTSIVYYNLDIFQGIISNESSKELMYNTIMYGVLHELSHSLQNINQVAYDNNPMYAKYIEDWASAYAVRFMSNYVEWIYSRTGIVVLDEFINKYKELVTMIITIDTIGYADEQIKWF